MLEGQEAERPKDKGFSAFWYSDFLPQIKDPAFAIAY
jgi:hypothetical protein